VAAGESVSDERLIRCILRGLPEEFAKVTEFLLYQSGLAADTVVSHLWVAEQRLAGAVEGATVLNAAAYKRPFDVSLGRLTFPVPAVWTYEFKQNCPEGSGRSKKVQARAPRDAVAMIVEAADVSRGKMLDGAVAKMAVGINITANGEISAEHAKRFGNAVAMAAVSSTAGGVTSDLRYES
jgi:hypothetical protein